MNKQISIFNFFDKDCDFKKNEEIVKNIEKKYGLYKIKNKNELLSNTKIEN